MTNKELIETIKIAKAEVEWYYPMDYQIAFDEAIEIIERMDKLSEVLTEAEQLHPYKIPGNNDTYSQYNEGWCDALDYIEGKMIKENEK